MYAEWKSPIHIGAPPRDPCRLSLSSFECNLRSGGAGDVNVGCGMVVVGL